MFEFWWAVFTLSKFFLRALLYVFATIFFFVSFCYQFSECDRVLNRQSLAKANKNGEDVDDLGLTSLITIIVINFLKIPFACFTSGVSSSLIQEEGLTRHH